MGCVLPENSDSASKEKHEEQLLHKFKESIEMIFTTGEVKSLGSGASRISTTLSSDTGRDDRTEIASERFKERHFDREAIVLCVRWFTCP